MESTVNCNDYVIFDLRLCKVDVPSLLRIVRCSLNVRMVRSFALWDGPTIP